MTVLCLDSGVIRTRGRPDCQVVVLKEFVGQTRVEADCGGLASNGQMCPPEIIGRDWVICGAYRTD